MTHLAHLLGIDVGGTDTKAVLLDPTTGQILSSARESTPRSVSGIVEAVAGLHARLGTPGARVGVAVPGLVDEAAGVAVHSENLGWRDVPFRALLGERLGQPVAFGHDVRAGGLAELRLGAGQGVRDLVFLPVGTGIAAALYLDGRPFAAQGYAGEIGHVRSEVDPEQPCACGASGCVEAIASAAAVARRYAARSGRPAAGAAEVLAAARAGDPLAAAVWSEALDALTDALALLASVLAPQTVGLGGGLSLAGEADLLAPLAARLDARLTFQRRPRLRAAALGGQAGAIGAALLAGDAALPAAAGW